MTSTVVDAHAHVIVPGVGAEVSWRDGVQVVQFGGREIRSAVREVVDLDRILEGPEDLRDLMADGPLAGVEVAASLDGDYLGHERFGEFWAAAEETRALVFVHPTTRGFQLPVMDEHYLWNTVGNPLETTITGAHLVTGGVMDEHPDLRILLAHGGGALPGLRGRLAHEQTFHPPGRDVLAAMRRFYV